MNTWSNAQRRWMEDQAGAIWRLNRGGGFFHQIHPELESSVMTDAFLTGVHLGRSLNLDPLQLSEARRLCWNQIRRSDERRRLEALPPSPVAIHLLWNLTSFVTLIRLRSLTIPQEPGRRRGAQVNEHNIVREGETQAEKRETEVLI